MEVGHNRLVHGSIPLDVSRLSVPVSVHVLVVLVEDGVLSSSPLSVAVRNRRVRGQDSSASPVEEIRVVSESLGVLGMVVQDQRSLVGETTASTSDQEVDHPDVHDGGTGVEALDGQFSDEQVASKASEESTRVVVSPVEIRSVHGSGHLVH